MFWDNVAWVYDIFVNVINRRTHEQLKEIIAALMERNDNVLECACGTGMLTQVMADKCMHVTATDYAEKMLKRAEKNCRGYSNITFEPADITVLPYPDNTFDKVAAGNVIHLLDEPLKALRAQPGMQKRRNADYSDLYEQSRVRGGQWVLESGWQSLRGLQAPVFLPYL